MKCPLCRDELPPLAAAFCAAGDWFEDAVWTEGRPNLPHRPFDAVSRALWRVSERLAR